MSVQINLNNILKSQKKVDTSLYRDLFSDLVFTEVPSNFPITKVASKNDIKTVINQFAVLNSFVNIMNTSPGEKILNPELGINLKKYLFAPITQTILIEIARDITEKLPQQEPRLRTKNVYVQGFPEENLITVDMEIIIPTLNNVSLPIKGHITDHGFSLVQ